jgi:hypothetical protein
VVLLWGVRHQGPSTLAAAMYGHVAYRHILTPQHCWASATATGGHGEDTHKGVLLLLLLLLLLAVLPVLVVLVACNGFQEGRPAATRWWRGACRVSTTCGAWPQASSSRVSSAATNAPTAPLLLPTAHHLACFRHSAAARTTCAAAQHSP